jgi:hypothetical protein
MLGKMNIRNQGLIAIAVGVLVLCVPLVLIALEFPETTKNAILDFTMLITCGVFMIAWVESRGFRHLLIGLFLLPLCFFAFNEVVGDLVTMLAAIGFAGWLVFGLVRKMRLQREITRYLAGVAVTALGIAGVASVADPGNKVHATLAFMLAATVYLAWRKWVADPKALASPKPPPPWLWSRDKDGNWRA